MGLKWADIYTIAMEFDETVRVLQNYLTFSSVISGSFFPVQIADLLLLSIVNE